MATQIKSIQLDLSGDGTSGVGAIEGVLKFSDLTLTEYLFIGESQGSNTNGSDIRTLTEFLGSAGTDYRINYGGAGASGDFIISKGSYTSTANEILRINNLGVVQLSTALGSPPVPYMFFGEGQNDSTIAPDLRFINDSLITTDNTLCILFDSTNNSTGSFTVGKAATNTLLATKLFEVENDGTLSVDTPGYENLVLDPNDIPNKAYVDANSGGGGGSNFFEFIFTATDGQTAFSGLDDNSNTLTYQIGSVSVHVNGIKLLPTEFVATDGLVVTINDPLITDDAVSIVAVSSTTPAPIAPDFFEFIYTAVLGQSAFSGLDDNSNTLTYQIGSVSVYVNGIKLIPTDFVATDGLVVTINDPLIADDVVSIVVTTSITPSFNTGVNNLIINGNFDIWQRGTSFVSIPTNTYNADRWVWETTGTQVIDINRSVDTPDESSLYSSFVNVTTANGVLAPTDNANITQRIEGNVYRSIVGQTATLSFWVKSNKIGTYCVSFKNDGLDRSYVAEYTIDAINTWEQKFITVPFTETGGTWNYDIGIGLRVSFVLTSGSSFQTTPNIWQTGNFDHTINQINLSDTINNEFRLTKVQLEIGNIVNDFEHRTLTEEVALCQRYYEKSYELETLAPTITTLGVITSYDSSVLLVNGAVHLSHTFNTRKRVIPTLVIYSPSSTLANRIRLAQGTNNGNYIVNSVVPSVNGMRNVIINSIAITTDDTRVWELQFTADSEL